MIIQWHIYDMNDITVGYNIRYLIFDYSLLALWSIILYYYHLIDVDLKIRQIEKIHTKKKSNLKHKLVWYEYQFGTKLGWSNSSLDAPENSLVRMNCEWCEQQHDNNDKKQIKKFVSPILTSVASNSSPSSTLGMVVLPCDTMR